MYEKSTVGKFDIIQGESWPLSNPELLRMFPGAADADGEGENDGAELEIDCTLEGAGVEGDAWTELELGAMLDEIGDDDG